MKLFKGYRTLLFAILVAWEATLEAALSTNPDWDQLLKQVLIAAAIAVLRFITDTPAGKETRE